MLPFTVGVILSSEPRVQRGHQTSLAYIANYVRKLAFCISRYVKPYDLVDISSVLPMFSRLTKIALRGTMGPFIFAFYRRRYGSTIIETLDIAPGHRAPHMDSSNPPFNYNRRDGGQMTNLLDSGTNPLCNTFHSGNTLRDQQKCKRLWEILLLLGVLRLRTDKSPQLLVSIDAKETFGIFCGREGWFWPKSAAGPRTVMSGCFFNPVH